MSIGILILRLVVGLSLAAHGAQKLFGWFGGPGLEKIAPLLEQLGFMLVFAVMLVAGVSAHLTQGFFVQNHRYEYTLMLGLAGLSIAFTGPGPVSLDARLGVQLAGPRWGVLAFGVGLVGAIVQLAGRQLLATQKGATAPKELS